MKQIGRLDSRKVLKQIYSYKQQLKEVIQSGGDFGQLHSNIIRLFKIVCSTKSEYNDVVRYPAPPPVREIVIHKTGPNGEKKKVERMSTFSETALGQCRKELARRLQVKLTELYEEYLQRSKLEKIAVRNCRTDIKNIKKELQNINNELLKLRMK
jgi:hypothetical protein